MHVTISKFIFELFPVFCKTKNILPAQFDSIVNSFYSYEYNFVRLWCFFKEASLLLYFSPHFKHAGNKFICALSKMLFIWMIIVFVDQEQG